MKNFPVVLFLFSSMCFTSAVQAQGERVLIPVFTFEPSPGAFGTRWVTKLTAFNASSETVTVRPTAFPCNLIPCPIDKFGPQTVFRPAIINHRDEIRHGYLYGSLLELDDIEFNLRVHDQSRGLGDWGTQIPVVRESHAYEADTTIQLLNVPVGESFRTHIRIYSFDRIFEPSRRFEVRVFTMDPGVGELLRVREDSTVGIESIELPGLIFLTDLFDGLEPGHEAVRVEIRPLEGERRFWAFASTTHNDTQHVTVVAPTLR